MTTLTFSISVPTDDGFLGRECGFSGCGRYFKVHQNSLRDSMGCPYCGLRFAKESLLTRDQAKYVKAQTIEHAKEYVYSEIDRMVGGLARQFRHGAVRITHQPVRYQAQAVDPTYSERKVDSELICPECQTQFQVFGIFGYCPGCRSENQLIYDTNLLIIRRELAANPNNVRALRHAYSDLVSSFEGFCRRCAAPTFSDTNFQDLFDARRAFKQHYAIDILQHIPTPDLLSLRRVFQKRHAHLHNNGEINQLYVRKVPEDSAMLGQTAELSAGEFEAAARALRSAIDQMASVRGSG